MTSFTAAISQKNYKIASMVQVRKNKVRVLTMGARILKSQNLLILSLGTGVQRLLMKGRRMALDGSEPALVVRI